LVFHLLVRARLQQHPHALQMVVASRPVQRSPRELLEEGAEGRQQGGRTRLIGGGGSGKRAAAIKGERNITKTGRIITEYLFDSDRKGRGETNQSGSNRSG
jgi:hypothetical protein